MLGSCTVETMPSNACKIVHVCFPVKQSVGGVNNTVVQTLLYVELGFLLAIWASFFFH